MINVDVFVVCYEDNNKVFRNLGWVYVKQQKQNIRAIILKRKFDAVAKLLKTHDGELLVHIMK